jgi:hypothetical protein
MLIDAVSKHLLVVRRGRSDHESCLVDDTGCRGSIRSPMACGSSRG